MSETETAESGFDVDIQHLSSVVLGALVVAVTAAWVAAEVADPLFVFAAVLLVSGYLLNQRSGDRSKFAFVSYSIVALLAVSPILFFLPDALAGRTEILSQMMTVVIARMLLLIAIIVGYIVYRLNGGIGVIQRARNPEKRQGLAAYLVAAVLLVLPFVLFLTGFIAGVGDVEVLSVLLWRIVALVAVAIAYAGYRADGGVGVVDRVQAVTAS